MSWAWSPTAETTELYRQILNHEFSLQTAETRPRHNLPIQTTNFIGRESELAEIQTLLLTDSDCRLLNLVGPGGIGKTRLALAAAMQVQDAFPDGVFFHPLRSHC